MSLKEKAGSQERINKDLAETLLQNKAFSSYIQQTRKDLFLQIAPGAEPGEYLYFDFDYSPTSSIIKEVVQKILNDFKLPPNFRDWICVWINTGKPSTGLPLYDLEAILDYPKDFQKDVSGITENHRREMKQLLRFLKQEKRITDTEHKELLEEINKIPKSVR